LADVIGNFLHRTFVFTKKSFDSKIPEYENPTEEDEEFRKAIENLPDIAGAHIANYEFREALVEIFRVAKMGNKYFNDAEPWKAVKEDTQKAANCLYLSNQLAKTLAYTLKPFLPTKADRIAEIMNIDSLDHWEDAKVPLPVGHEINKAKPLFKKIEDEEIEAQKAKLKENLTEKEDDNMSDLITIDQFDEVVIKIGQVKEAEKIEKSDKLLKLQVDIGEEKPRQIVAGLAKFYSPEELVDRKVCVVANLQPAKLFGTLSEGMILATGESGALLAPDVNAQIGERIQ
jgi:methionyl-tRNA synthetase